MVIFCFQNHENGLYFDALARMTHAMNETVIFFGDSLDIIVKEKKYPNRKI